MQLLKRLDRRLVTILLIVLVQMVGAAMILPILPLFALREFNLSPQVITLLNSSFFAAQFLAGPYLGRLSDRHGRVPVLIFSQVGTALSFLLLAWAPTTSVLFAARILDGITGGNIIVAQAYVTDITPPEKRTQSLGYIMAIFGVGFILGPALGGVLAAAFGPRIPYVMASIAAMLTVLLTYMTLRESVSAKERAANRRKPQAQLGFRALGQNRQLLLVLIVAFIGQFGFGLLQSTFALYGATVLFTNYTPEATNIGVGLLLAAIGTGQVITQLFLIRPALRRYSEPKLVIVGNGLRAGAMLIFALITTPWLGPIGSILFAMGMGFVMPALQAMATQVVADDARGGILGIVQSVNNLGIIGSTAIAGVIFAVNPTLPYWLGALLSLLAIVPSVVLLRKGNFKPNAKPQNPKRTSPATSHVA